MGLSAEEVRHIAILARVGVTDEDVKLLQEQLSNILENFEVINSVDTEGVPPTAHAVPMRNVMRKDDVQPSYPVGEILTNAPNSENNFIKVKIVLDF